MRPLPGASSNFDAASSPGLESACISAQNRAFAWSVLADHPWCSAPGGQTLTAELGKNGAHGRSACDFFLGLAVKVWYGLVAPGNTMQLSPGASSNGDAKSSPRVERGRILAQNRVLAWRVLWANPYCQT